MEDHEGAGWPVADDFFADPAQEHGEEDQSEADTQWTAADWAAADGADPGGADPDEADPDGAGTGEVAAGRADPGEGLPVAAALTVPRPETGEPRVDDALSLLDDLPELPVAEHPDVFARVHAQLGEVLGELASGPLAGAAARDGS